jgi:hypothetical protein
MIGLLLCKLGFHGETSKHITAWGMYRRHCLRCEKTMAGWF